MGTPVLVPVPRSTMFMGCEELKADSGAIQVMLPVAVERFNASIFTLTQHYEQAK
jgi:hypothetical protein